MDQNSEPRAERNLADSLWGQLGHLGSQYGRFSRGKGEDHPATEAAPIALQVVKSSLKSIKNKRHDNTEPMQCSEKFEQTAESLTVRAKVESKVLSYH